MNKFKAPKLGSEMIPSDNAYAPQKRANCSMRAKKFYKSEQDPFWYAADQKSLETMASISFNTAFGGDIGEEIPSIASKYTDHVPAVIVVNERPTIGNFVETDINNTVTSNAQRFFNSYTTKFKASVPYEATDLFMATISGASLVPIFAEGKRAIGLINSFKQLNPSYARTAVSALGFDYDDLTTNYLTFITYYNQRVASFNSLVVVPNDLPIVQRWTFANSYMFTDTSSPEFSTSYAFKMTHALKYDGISSSTGTCLRWHEIIPERPSTTGVSNPKQKLLTVAEYFRRIDEILEPLSDSEPIKMFSAIRDVLSDGDILTLEEMSSGFETPIVQHDVVAAQFHNLFVSNQLLMVPAARCPAKYIYANQTQYDVVCYQIGKVICCEPGYLINKDMDEHKIMTDRYSKSDYIIDMYDHMVSPGNIMDITNSIAPIRYYKDDAVYPSQRSFFSVACRGELFTGMYAYRAGMTFNTSVDKSYNVEATALVSYIIIDDDVDINSFRSMRTKLASAIMLSHCDSHPLVHIYDVDNRIESHPVLPTGFIGELDRYTYMSGKQLAELNMNTIFRLVELPMKSAK